MVVGDDVQHLAALARSQPPGRRLDVETGRADRDLGNTRASQARRADDGIGEQGGGHVGVVAQAGIGKPGGAALGGAESPALQGFCLKSWQEQHVRPPQNHSCAEDTGAVNRRGLQQPSRAGRDSSSVGAGCGSGQRQQQSAPDTRCRSTCRRHTLGAAHSCADIALALAAVVLVMGNPHLLSDFQARRRRAALAPPWLPGVPVPHPERPAAVGGCRSASRGLTLKLVT